MWSLTRPAPERVVRFPLPLSAGQNFSATGRHIVAISPTHDYVAFSANGGLWLRAMDQMEATFLSGSEEGREAFFSADGQWLGFYADGQLKRVSISGGAPVTLGEAENPFGASWGADDTILFGQSDGIWRVPGTGGTPELIISVEDGEAVLGPQMLPGGDFVLFTLRPSGTSSWDASQIVVQSLASSERTVLIEGGRDARYVPTGHLVYGLEGTLLAQAFDLDQLAMRGGPVALVEGVRMAAGGSGAAQFSVSGDGSLVYVPGSGGAAGSELGLVWVDREGQQEALDVPAAAYVRPRVSPEGTRVVAQIDEGGTSSIWIADATRGTLSRVTSEAANDSSPVWTPDGQQVVFTSDRDGARGLFRKSADGTGEVERLATMAGPRTGTASCSTWSKQTAETSACSRWRASGLGSRCSSWKQLSLVRRSLPMGSGSRMCQTRRGATRSTCNASRTTAGVSRSRPKAVWTPHGLRMDKRSSISGYVAVVDRTRWRSSPSTRGRLYPWGTRKCCSTMRVIHAHRWSSAICSRNTARHTGPIRQSRRTPSVMQPGRSSGISRNTTASYSGRQRGRPRMLGTSSSRRPRSPIHQWPRGTAAAVSSIKSTKMNLTAGDGIQEAVVEVQIVDAIPRRRSTLQALLHHSTRIRRPGSRQF